ncbi:TetR/AcrR family transcriptional regulator [Paracidovorax sp. MALMAid1276]|uniref:TetR/AcrR family transcriptional regulator n=1 Tax=Paracidovorax sp. MALMAid1276 TaxID=3411631 RepID=UPI003B9C61DE
MEPPVRRPRASSSRATPAPAHARPGAAPVLPASEEAPPTPRRPRGRPRKTAEELDDGNRRRKLMDSAAQLFIDKGFAATSTRDIAAAVGMHSGSPFYHFESKSALLYAVMNEGMATAVQSQQAALDAVAQGTPAATARARLRVLIRHHFEVLLGPHSGFIPVMLYEWRSLTPAQRKSIARVKDTYEAAWMPTLQALARQKALQADPDVARLFIFGALNWAVQWFAAPRKSRPGKSLDELTDEAMALFIHKA